MGSPGEWPDTPKLDSCDGVASIGDAPDYYLMGHEEVQRVKIRVSVPCFTVTMPSGTRQW